MGGSGRKRNSKWDLKEESRISFDSVQGSAWHGKTGSSLHDKESQRGWVSPEAAGINRSKWSAVDSFPARRGSRRDDSIDEDRNRSSKAMTTLEGNESYGTRMSPGLDEWRHQNSHQSPKNEWKRSRRSRSRSRSPVHSFRHESGAYDRSTSRSGFSAQICKDFPSGRCRRGSHCQFLHQGSQSYDDDWERQRKPVASKYSIPNDSEKTSHEVSRERDNDRRHRYASPERVGEREIRRASDIPCKFFSAGNCRHGKYCKFSHNSQTNASPEKRPRDGRWPVSEKSDAVEKTWNGPGWSDTNTSSDALLNKDKGDKLQNSERSQTAWPVDDDWGHSLARNRTHSDLPMSKTVESDKRESHHWKTENTGDNVHVSEKRVSENWPGDMDMSPDWNYSIQPSNHTVKGGHASFSSSAPGITLEVSGQMRDAITTMPRVVNDIQLDSKLMEVGNSFSHNDNVAGGTSASSHVHHSASDLATQSFTHRSLGSNPLTLPNLKAVGPSLGTTLGDPSRGEIMVNPQNQTLFLEKKAINKLHNGDSNVSKVNSLVPSSQNTVSGEQFNHLTNIQASLAQLLANGQQLPQLYATHNSHNGGNVPVSANLEGLAGPDTTVTIQPNQLVGSHKQYDPICDSVEPDKHDDPPGSRSNLIEQRNVADSMPQMPSKDASHPSSSSATNGGRYNKFLSLEEESGGKSFASNSMGTGANTVATKDNPEVEALGSRKTLEESKIAEENGPSENIDDEVKGDESKKSKDAKGVRAFKFSLVEVVKDLLKPAWKEGQIKKDAYKNIVKKVVDKVTSTMQGTSIPQTQEKIDQYLSFSKPKLTKLVQAYVEKFQKDK